MPLNVKLFFKGGRERGKRPLSGVQSQASSSRVPLPRFTLNRKNRYLHLNWP